MEALRVQSELGIKEVQVRSVAELANLVDGSIFGTGFAYVIALAKSSVALPENLSIGIAHPDFSQC